MSERKPLFKHAQITRLPRLLDMLYKPAEIAEEIEVTSDTVYRSYLPAGAPHERDAKGSIWIHGASFRAWALEIVQSRKQKRVPMPEGKAWCVRCKQAVRMTNPKPKVINRYLEILQAKCPNCGGIVNRARGRKESAGDMSQVKPASKRQSQRRKAA